MEQAGEIKQFSKGLDIEWKIPNFNLSKKVDESYYSPSFSFRGKPWNLWIYPNGRNNLVGLVHLYFVKQSKDPSKKLKVALGLKIFNEKENKKMVDAKFDPELTYTVHSYLSRSELLLRKSEFLSSNALTVLCSLEDATEELSDVETANCAHCKELIDAKDIRAHEKMCVNKPIKCPDCSIVVALKNWYDHKCQMAKRKGDVATANCAHCKELIDVKDISAHEKMCVNKPIKCPDCSIVVALKNWYDHKCQMAKGKANEKLVRDLKNVMVSGDHSDTIIQVKGQEFRLHRTILGARNPFFYSMFTSDMKENKTGIVTIEDCQPDAFRSFIHFLYTSEVDKLSEENVCDLFKVADKYQENQLREECLQFMMNSISVESFSDFIIVALKHDEKELLENATKFFASKTKEIICSVKWLTFLQEYPVYANELHIKALDIHRGSS